MIFDNQYEKLRIEKAEELKSLGVNPYNNRVSKELSNLEFLKKFEYVLNLEEKKDISVEVWLAGRIKFLRAMGKAIFAKIEDEVAQVQIYFNRDGLGEEWFKNVSKLIEVGDIISVKGYPFITKTGELSLHVSELILATKAIVPLPEKYHGLVDVEARYRQRYLDLIMNAQVKDVFKKRSQIVSLLRKFFEGKGFLEVETPMMHPIAGGANARPFVTHHNALGVDRYLRIAPELYLKRLIVGGFEAVFEINRNFRNEGMDHTHNPEFTMLEYYWAYKKYDDLMRLSEEMFDYIFSNLGLNRELEYDGKVIDFTTPFKKISYVDAIVEIGGVEKDIATNLDKCLEFIKSKNLEVPKNISLGTLQATLFDNFVEDKLINPTFVTDFPIDISPLARRSDTNLDIAERFELFIASKEIANGFSELNDPLDQYERFAKQVESKNAGDDEAHEMDSDYVRALGYGMAPTAGQGIGIDRLVMLLTNSHSIKDVLLFPAMRLQQN